MYAVFNHCRGCFLAVYIQAIMTMVPEAWQENSLMNMQKQDFYRWISCTMEAWDGPGM